MDAEIIAAQTAVAQAFMRQAHPNWQHILVNVELKQLDDGVYSDVVAFAIIPVDGGYEDESITLDEAAMAAVGDLREAMARASKQAPWLGMELTVDPPGHYRLTFSYEPGKRVEGKHDHQSYYRFNTYVREWAAHRAVEAPR